MYTQCCERKKRLAKQVITQSAHPKEGLAYTTNEWIEQEATPFSLNSTESFNAAVDQMVASMGDSVELLGFGEALHGGEELLILRNRLFQRLVEAHGYSTIAVESSFPRGHIVNEYVNGRGGESIEAVEEAGLSQGFGRLEANRELFEWMRGYNAASTHAVKLHFYGFDSPTFMPMDSPRQLLHFVLDYLASVDSSHKYRERMTSLLGDEFAWGNPAAMMDPTQAIGLSPEATALRIETEELISELSIRRPELVAQTGQSGYVDALHYASQARQLLNYHAELARASEQRVDRLLGIRDAMMADNLAYIVSRERGRGKVLAFAHNEHLRRGEAQWKLGADLPTWWPVGAHLNLMFGSRYAVIGSAVGVSEDNGIGKPEAGTLEALLTAVPGPVRFIPTHTSQGLLTEVVATLPVRSGSVKNRSYFPLTPQSVADFDWLAVLDATTFSRGGTQFA
jgi:erythromycin esterase